MSIAWRFLQEHIEYHNVKGSYDSLKKTVADWRLWLDDKDKHNSSIQSVQMFILPLNVPSFIYPLTSEDCIPSFSAVLVDSLSPPLVVIVTPYYFFWVTVNGRMEEFNHLEIGASLGLTKNSDVTDRERLLLKLINDRIEEEKEK